MRGKAYRGNLARAVAKLIYCQGKQWGGYLTPAEILAVEKAGAVNFSWAGSVERAVREVGAGTSTCSWTYFELQGELKRLVGERNGR